MAKIKFSPKTLLGFDSLHFLGISSLSQTFPFILINAFLSLRLSSKTNKAIFMEFFYLIYGIFISIFIFYFSREYALDGLLRQTISYFLGIMILAYFLGQKNFCNFNSIINWVNFLSIAIFLTVLVQFFFTNERPTGFSSEPSHLGDLICLLLLPLAIITKEKNKKYITILMLLLASLFLTQSATSYLKFIIFISIMLMFSSRALFLLFILLVAYLITWSLSTNFGGYFFIMLQSDLNLLIGSTSGSFSGSFVDRFIGILMIPNLEITPNIVFGGGLGCELDCFFPAINQSFSDTILEVKSYPPTISPYLVKNIFYFGIIPSIFLFWFYVHFYIKKFRILQASEKSIFITIFIASIFSLGPYWLPYIWFWKAYLIKK